MRPAEVFHTYLRSRSTHMRHGNGMEGNGRGMEGMGQEHLAKSFSSLLFRTTRDTTGDEDD